MASRNAQPPPTTAHTTATAMIPGDTANNANPGMLFDDLECALGPFPVDFVTCHVLQNARSPASFACSAARYRREL